MPIDYSEYPANWKEIRERILSRAANCCEWCGAKNHEPHPDTGSMVILTIAHLDHDKHNHEVKDDRLAALCQRCHLGYDRDHHVRMRRENMHNTPGQLELIRAGRSLPREEE